MFGEGGSTSPPFKGCHGITATAYLRKEKVFGTTDIWSHCDFGGFTGVAAAILVDSHGTIISEVVS